MKLEEKINTNPSAKTIKNIIFINVDSASSSQVQEIIKKNTYRSCEIRVLSSPTNPTQHWFDVQKVILISGKDEPSFKRNMQRGNSRLKAWILSNSSSNLLRKSCSKDILWEASGVEERWQRNPVTVLRRKEGLKSKLGSS